ncbi:ribonuclease MRP protein subunit POP4 isoform X2 [Beta vulgaris subsp. vulgaris]|uniref:ribonuclease MRP protein subunit POP4 isoform X2 n=1 Tax=Beta vulgaris subsp. vulgaris TaxID=3555 RepID=UPI00053F6F73|nr:ribonuclease MRP protein subunit POP4 isoform X2 [Beta vulgaris subsp. vulgaris]
METKTVADDQKKRALEALERRFAFAKAESQRQQGRQKRRRDNSNLKPAPAPTSSAGPSVEASPAFGRNTSSTKDLESDGLTYSSICQPVHKNLLTAVETSNEDKSAVDKILHELLQKGDSAQKYIQGSRSIKMENWILLDKFVQANKPSVARLRALQANSKRSKKHMSMKQLKKCGLLNLPQKLRKFELFLPMHDMWKDYVMQLLKNSGKNHVAQSLLVADLHGAILRVIECKIDSFIGVVGIMIRETAETFGIITQENNFRVVPKRNSVFVFQADCWRITLHGDKCTSRKLDIS